MPIYQDDKTKTWYVKCYYTDYTGTKRQRKKRGFKLQRDAKDWERNFLETQQADLTMTFLEKVSDKPQARACFLTLYYTGLRIGARDVITPPKTPRSVRTISIPEFLRDELRTYTKQFYDLHKHDRIFPYTKHFFEHEMNRGTKDGEVKKIRLHDIRHTYAINFDGIFLLLINNPVEFQSPMSARIN